MSGRDVSRKLDDDVVAGTQLSVAVLRFIKAAPEPYKSDFRSLLLAWSEQKNDIDTYDEIIPFSNGLQQLKQDPEIHVAEHNTGFHILPMSDRVVFHDQNWSATLAMSSRRTGLYESLNFENLNPFYQAAGALQIYLDNDREQYLNDYYPTMNPYHTPGVTAGQNLQSLAPYGTTAVNYWGGGVKWKHLGAASLDYISYDKQANAKKSWFFLGNVIIALGIACNSLSGTELHTTVEARKSPDNSPRLLVDGQSAVDMPWSKTFANPSWAHIDGVGGYHFLDSGNVTCERSTNTGKWTDINQYPDYAQFNDTLNREYVTIYRNHAVDPVNGSYAYAILPNATALVTAKRAEFVSYRLVSNTDHVQAVTMFDKHTTMATFWKPGTVFDIEALTACQIAWGYSNDGDKSYTLAIADPSQRATKVQLWLRNSDVGGILSKDPEIELLKASRSGKLIQVDVRESRGKTYSITFERDTKTPMTASLMSWVFILLLFTVVITICLPQTDQTQTHRTRRWLQRLFVTRRSY